MYMHICMSTEDTVTRKDHKDRTAFLEFDKRRENGTKSSKKHNFQVCSIRSYYAAARMSLRLTRPSYVLSRA